MRLKIVKDNGNVKMSVWGNIVSEINMGADSNKGMFIGTALNPIPPYPRMDVGGSTTVVYDVSNQTYPYVIGVGLSTGPDKVTGLISPVYETIFVVMSGRAITKSTSHLSGVQKFQAETSLNFAYRIPAVGQAVQTCVVNVTIEEHNDMGGVLAAFAHNSNNLFGNDELFGLGEGNTTGASPVVRAARALSYAAQNDYIRCATLEGRYAMDGQSYVLDWKHVFDRTAESVSDKSRRKSSVANLVKGASRGKYTALTEIAGLVLLGQIDHGSTQPVLANSLVNDIDELDLDDLQQLSDFLEQQYKATEGLYHVMKVSSSLIKKEVEKRKRREGRE